MDPLPGGRQFGMPGIVPPPTLESSNKSNLAADAKSNSSEN